MITKCAGFSTLYNILYFYFHEYKAKLLVSSFLNLVLDNITRLATHVILFISILPSLGNFSKVSLVMLLIWKY
jgi:hypothetical protein